jgi:hypothetical protein
VTLTITREFAMAGRRLGHLDDGIKQPTAFGCEVEAL